MLDDIEEFGIGLLELCDCISELLVCNYQSLDCVIFLDHCVGKVVE